MKPLLRQLSPALLLALSIALTSELHAAPPANDNLANATVITGSSAAVFADNTDATQEAGESHYQTVWWKWTAPAHGRVSFNSVNSVANNLRMRIYLEETAGVAGGYIGGSDATAPGLSFPVAQGTTVVVRMGISGPKNSYGQTLGRVNLALNLSTTDPVGSLTIGNAGTMRNDAFDQRITLTGNTPSAVGYNYSASNEAGEPSTSGYGSFWWTFRPAVNGRLTLTTTNSDSFNKSVAVYLGSSLASLRRVSYKTGSLVTFSIPVTAGTDYQISLGSQGPTGGYNGSGSFVLGLSLNTLSDLEALNLPNPATMVNDAFDQRVTLTGDKVSGMAYNATGTNESGEPVASSGYSTFWWSYRPSANGRLMITNEGSDDFSQKVAVYLGSSLTNMRLVGYGSGYGVVYSIPVTAGIDYLISTGSVGIPGSYSSSGSIVLSLALDKDADVSQMNIPGPATASNDNFVNRVALSGNTVSAIGYNLAATHEALEPAATGQMTLWWSWTSASSGKVLIDFAGTTFNSFTFSSLKPTVWTGAAISPLSPVGLKFGSTAVEFDATAGQTYQIAVGTTNTSYAGSIVMTIYGSPSKPVFTSNPASRLVPLGSTVALSANTDGTQIQWLKNAVAIAGATSGTYSISNALLTSVGAYSVKATNTLGFTTSAVANVGVVNTTDSAVAVGEGGTLVLTASAAGPGLKYRWRFGTEELFDSKVGTRVISGAATSKLSITAVTATDAGAYSCLVSMDDPQHADAPLTLPSGAFNTTVVSKPVVTDNPVPPAAVSRAFTWQLAASGSPTGYIVLGLPSGLTFNAVTGLVSGIPNAVGQPKVKVSAKNVAGTGLVKEFTLNITSLPVGTEGIFSGMITRGSVLNNSLGGWFTMTVTSSGSFTGSLKNGVATYPITAGRLNVPLSGNPTAIVNIPRASPLPALVLSLAFNGASNAVTGTLSNGVVSSSVEGRRHIWTGKAAAAYAAAYNSVVELPDGSLNDTAQPLGCGWQQMTATSAGVVTGTGRTADGITYTFGGTLWPDGSLPQFVLIYANKIGSITGLPQITLGATIPGNRVIGWVEQIKNGPASVTDHNYGTGIPHLRRNVDGAPWIKPVVASPIVLGLPDEAGNADIAFTQGAVESVTQFASLAQIFRITKTNTTTFATVTTGNPCAVKMTITASTGLFTGSFTLTDTVAGKPVPRLVNYAGILLSHTGMGYGYFTLPGLSPSVTTSPILSGRVVVD